jgi:hypothetical protein
MAWRRSQSWKKEESFRVSAFGYYPGFQGAMADGGWAASLCGVGFRLWRRAHFGIGRSEPFSGMARGGVCDGDHSPDVMNPWEGRPSLRDRAGRPVRCV